MSELREVTRWQLVKALDALALRESALEVAEQAKREVGDVESYRAANYARDELERVVEVSAPLFRAVAERVLALERASAEQVVERRYEQWRASERHEAWNGGFVSGHREGEQFILSQLGALAPPEVKK